MPFLNPKARHIFIASIVVACVYLWTNNNDKPLLMQVQQRNQSATVLVGLVGTVGILSFTRGQSNA